MLSASAIRRDPPRLPQAGSRGTASAVAGVAPSIFVDSLDDLYMYCYDLYEQVHAGQRPITPSTSMAPRRAPSIFSVRSITSSTVAATIGVIPSRGFIRPVPSRALRFSSASGKANTIAAGSLGSGSFKASGLETATQNWWLQFRAAVLDGAVADLDPSFAMTLEAPGVQDMITGDPQALPEPASALLVALGLAGIGAARPRRRR